MINCVMLLKVQGKPEAILFTSLTLLSSLWVGFDLMVKMMYFTCEYVCNLSCVSKSLLIDAELEKQVAEQWKMRTHWECKHKSSTKCL